jgi:hypothetical protein
MSNNLPAARVACHSFPLVAHLIREALQCIIHHGRTMEHSLKNYISRLIGFRDLAPEEDMKAWLGQREDSVLGAADERVYRIPGHGAGKRSFQE